MKYSFVLCFILAAVQLNLMGQILDNYQGKLYSGECIFNEQFVRENKIKRISGVISVKKEMQPIRKLGTIDQYTFNTQGKLIEHLKSFRMRGGRIDTTQDYYQYNDLEHLTTIMSYDLSGYDASRYKYGPNGELVEEKFLRGENRTPYSGVVEKGRETVIKSGVL